MLSTIKFSRSASFKDRLNSLKQTYWLLFVQFIGFVRKRQCFVRLYSDLLISNERKNGHIKKSIIISQIITTGLHKLQEFILFANLN